MTKIEFRNFNGEYCAFTEDSVIFADSNLKEAKVFPIGSIKKITAKFGVKLIAYNGEKIYFTFIHMRKRIKNKIRELVEKTNEYKNSAEQSDPYTMEIDEAKKESIEQIRKPHVSKKRIIKFWATIATFIATVLILITLIIGLANEQSNKDDFYQYGEEAPTWNELWK